MYRSSSTTLTCGGVFGAITLSHSPEIRPALIGFTTLPSGTFPHVLHDCPSGSSNIGVNVMTHKRIKIPSRRRGLLQSSLL
jgi:hypothetical protein